MSDKTIQERLREHASEDRAMVEEGRCTSDLDESISDRAQDLEQAADLIDRLTAAPSEDDVEREKCALAGVNYTSMAAELIPADLVDILERMERQLRELGADYAANCLAEAAICLHRVYDFIAGLPAAKDSLMLLNLRAEQIRRDEREKCIRNVEAALGPFGGHCGESTSEIIARQRREHVCQEAIAAIRARNEEK